MTLSDFLLQLGYVMIAVGAILGTWALITGPLSRSSRSKARRDRPARRT